MARHADDIAFFHAMTSKTNTHGPGCVFLNTGHLTEGFPSSGAWVSYALGAENRDLPTYVALPDVRGEPPNGKANWSNGFLPAQHQAIVLGAQQPIRNLEVPPGVSAEEEADTRALLVLLQRAPCRATPWRLGAAGADRGLRAGRRGCSSRPPRSATWAASRRRSASSTGPTTPIRSRPPTPATACWPAACWSAASATSTSTAPRASGVDGLLNWDAHKTLKSDYERHCPIFDQPTAALLTDLKQGGLLDDTLVLWTTEFGRMPTHQAGSIGRDHNADAFTCWMMGAGVKGGISYGATDEFGRRAVENVTTVWDFYATVLHLLGFDHERLTWYYNGLARRLTDVHGHVIREVLA